MFSRATGREGRCRQISLACVGSTHGVPATLGLPLLTGVCFPCLHCSGSWLLHREWALCCVWFPGLSCSDSGFRVLHKSVDSVGPAFCAFPARAAQAPRSLMGALSQVWCAFSPSRPQPQFPRVLVGCTLCQLWGADFWLLPSPRMSTIQNLRKSLVRIWEPVCSLVRVPSLGPSLPLSPPPPRLQ